ncbi:ATP-binding protein [Clostridium sp. WILCCON 0269]|uniref:ATP-binding protein n=1 Tax=Candidatus Clostridium eludens TaxID=3381663 RepID=A0ABW8SR37_9CLOT
MPYEKGGRADKSGNEYERRWVIYQILRVIEEELVSVELESIGEDEKGIDIWVTSPDGSREGQQCKGRNASKEEWDISSLKSKKIIKNWKKQLDRCSSNKVALVSPLSCQMLEDLIKRAKNTNSVPKDFLNYQIKKSSKEFINFFYGCCSEFNLDSEVDMDLCKIINYLSRISYHQVPDSFQKEIVLNKIQYLFIEDKNNIYNCLENLVAEGEYLGKTITNSFLRGYLKENKILFRALALDTKVASRIEELNDEYKKIFVPINGELLFRNEFKLCTDNIKDGKSIIIHGKAGSGKSGCTQAIISFCESDQIPYIAITLDKRIPNGSAEKWGKDLGLPASISHSLHSVAKNENAVIILDQLDALRWTQAHSRDALIICSEIIRQVTNLNLERNRKISVVLVCRTYDLENDNNIKSLFKKTSEEEKSVEWLKILVKEFDENTVKNIVGKDYDKLSKKLKYVLRIPSNLYIWQHLDRKKAYDEFSTANELLCEWWSQLLDRCEDNEIDEQSVWNAKESIVDRLDKCGMMYTNRKLLNVTPRSLKYLASNGFLTLIGNNVSFAHQSILDYFLVDKMLHKYDDGENIINIIGTKKNQIPGKRYQIQMLLQNIEEYYPNDFVNVGKQMLECSDVRFYVKYVFLEVLGQCTSINSSIKDFVMEYLEKEEFANHIIDNVIVGHAVFVEFLLKSGILDKWMQDDTKKNVAINLMISLHPQYSNNDVKFIKKYAFISKENTEKLFRCFSFNIQEDTDEMFELRMEFYERYPQMVGSYINFKEMFRKCELRTTRVFELLLKYKIKSNSRSVYNYGEKLTDENNEVLKENGEIVVDKLLPYIPQEREYYNIYLEWDGRYAHNSGLERACVEIIKKANAALINKNPEAFIERHKKFMGKGYVVFSEIILTALAQLPSEFSDMVVSYIAANLNENIFDKTSSSKDELALVKDVLRKHTLCCSKYVFLLLENTIICYIDPRAKEWYTRRIEYNKNNKNGDRVYWSFWGDMQMALLSCLPLDRMSEQAKGLLKVLNRRFENVPNIYTHFDCRSGPVSSSVAGKRLGNRQWLQILTNNKLKKRNVSRWSKIKGRFIENSIEEFSTSFREAVSSEPERFIKLLLNCDKYISEIYIDSLFVGVAFSNQLNDVSTDLLEKMILKYSYNYDSFRASYICDIIEKKEGNHWSQNIIDILNDIAINHCNPNSEKLDVTSIKYKEMKSFDMLQSNAFNCVRGNAAMAIGNLLWSNKELYVQFKETVLKLCNDINPAIRLANLYSLSPIYNIDRDWATERILNIFEEDYRMAGYHDSKQLFFLMYPKFRECVLKVILRCYFSDDKDMIKVGAHSLAEMYIRNGEFQDEIFDVENMNETQIESIIEMAVLYFNTKEYNDLAKTLIKKYKFSKFDLEFSISKVFYNNLIDLERDKDFLIEIMKSNMGKRIIYAFAHYLEENSKSVIEYKDIIFSISYNLIENHVENSGDYWGIGGELSKLIIGLYDEVSQASDENLKYILQQCLDIWDLMFEKRIGSARVLSWQILDR